MRTLREWLYRLVGTLRPHRGDQDLQEELRLHIDLAAARGTRIVGTAQAMDALRDQRGLPWLEQTAADLRQAFRALRRSAAFTSVAVGTLALGLGATVAMFSVLDQVVLRPLPYPDIDRLVRVESPVPGIRPDAVWNLSTAEYFYFRREARTLERMGIFVTSFLTIGAEAQPDSNAERVVTVLGSAEMLDLLGARPLLGRLLREDDQRYEPRNGPPVAIISDRLWQHRFGGASDIIGRTITLEDRPIPIAGVVATDIQPPIGVFLGRRTADVWLPLSLNPNTPAINQHTFYSVARLRPGIAPSVAQEELAALTRGLSQAFPAVYSPAFVGSSGFSTAVVPLRDDVLGATSRTLWILAAAIALLFVIAAANVTNLFVLHAEGRKQELVTRLALGATRMRLARYLFAESLLLSLLAAGIAVGLAFVSLRALVLIAPENIPRLGGVRLDWRSAAAAVIAGLASAVCFASFTVARFSRATSEGLPQSAFANTPYSCRTRSALVMVQVAMSLVLACGAALMAQSVSRLLAVDPGFDPNGVLSITTTLPRIRYQTEEQIADYHRQLAELLESDAEIDAVSAATTIPFDGNDGCSAVSVEGRSRFDANNSVCVDVSRVTPAYFDVLGIAVRGRVSEWRARETGAVVVSESAARRIWPGEDPIGKGLRVNGSTPPFYEVVGVAEDVRRLGFSQPPAESVYFPAVSLAGAPIFAPPRVMRVVMRTRTRNMAALIARVRMTVGALDRNVPITDVEPMETLVAQSMARNSLAASFLIGAAFLAIVLSAVGLYGVISYGVASRRREFGVRLAVGAAPAGLRTMVLRETIALVIPGLAAGAIASLWSTPLLGGLLYGIEAGDLATLAGVSGVLLMTGLAAGVVPAWRASGTDPLMALRCG